MKNVKLFIIFFTLVSYFCICSVYQPVLAKETNDCGRINKELLLEKNSLKYFDKQNLRNLYTCKIKVNGTINGATIEGEITIEGIGFLKCAAIKIADIFDSRF